MVGPKRKTPRKIQTEARFGKLKTRSMRMLYVKTPGGRTVIHFKKRKVSNAACALCGKQLPGTVHGIISKVKKANKAKKRPSRPYGGNLCSICMRKKLIREARAK